MPDRPIRILQALTTTEIGGTELMVLRLISRLDRSRIQCEVSVLDGRGPVAGWLARMGIPVHDLGQSATGLAEAVRLAALLRKRRFDLLHLYGFRVSLIGRVAARFVRPRPVVIHGIRGLHVSEVPEVSSWRTWLVLTLEKALTSLVDLYITNSPDARTFLGRQGFPARKLRTIPNGVEVVDREPRGRREAGGAPVLTCVANFRRVKRQGDLIEAVALLRGRGAKLRCVLVGDGPARDDLETAVREHGLDGVVDFLGRCDPEKVPALLQAADIFALPSLWEGMPGSVLEAMAAGLPVVATDVPGSRSVVREGVTGFLVPPKAPALLAERIERLLGDATLRARMGEAGRARVQAEFSLDRMVARHTQIYLDLAQRGDDRRPPGRTGQAVTPDGVGRPGK